MVCDHRAAHGERAGGGEVDLLFRLGERLLLVLLEQLGGGIDVVLGPIHAAKVRPRGGSGHPARTCACARRRVRAPPCPPRVAGECATKPMSSYLPLGSIRGRARFRKYLKHSFTTQPSYQAFVYCR